MKRMMWMMLRMKSWRRDEEKPLELWSLVLLLLPVLDEELEEEAAEEELKDVEEDKDELEDEKELLLIMEHGA
jgi:hypothetical protein